MVRLTDVSLTARRAKLAEIGTLVLTNQRLVFLICGEPIAYCCDVSLLDSMIPEWYPRFPDFNVWRVRASDGECFSFQICAAHSNSLQNAVNVLFSRFDRESVEVVIIPPRPVSLPVRELSLIGLEKVKRVEDNALKEKQDGVADGLVDMKTMSNMINRLTEIADSLRRDCGENAVSEMTEICLAIASDGLKFDPSVGISEQFDRFVADYLKRRGVGGISLSECFAAFNRHLLTNWVTPKEFLGAVADISKDSKALIRIERIGHDQLVTSKESSYESVIESIKRTVNGEDFVTPIKIASQYKIPIVVARMYLSRGERRGILAVDDSIGGLRFYKNRFMSFSLMKV
jgi:hypothetical protein